MAARELSTLCLPGVGIETCSMVVVPATFGKFISTSKLEEEISDLIL